MSTIAHCLIWYLPPTMGYVHDQLLALGADRSAVLALHPDEPDRFPLDRVYILSPLETVRHLPRCRLAISPPMDRLWRPIVREENVAALHVHDGRLAPSFLPLARHFSDSLDHIVHRARRQRGSARRQLRQGTSYALP